jgi:tRNA pseudouridine55 synthase
VAPGAKGRSAEVDGLLLLDKPAGMTSNRALQTVKRLLRARKAGHTGSLDPAATGMLPLCFGEATKVCAYLLEADKTYRVTARLGVATDTGDADGEQAATAPVPALSPTDWAAVLDEFLGTSIQVPPMYSALKNGGKRLYELARKGEVVERKARPVTIHSIRLLEAAGTRLVFRVHCSKGTYVRTLVEDIAKRAGTVAHTARLHRESVGSFAGEDMLGLEEIRALADQGEGALRARLMTPDMALQHLPAVTVEEAAAGQFGSGQAVAATDTPGDGLVRVYDAHGCFLGVGEVIRGAEVAPRRVFRTTKKNL